MLTRAELADMSALARAVSWPTRFQWPRPRLRVLLVLALLAGLLGAIWLYLRDSSLVAVERIQISGASGPDAAQLREALTAAARTMTTLDVDLGRLRTAVAPYPEVQNLRVSTQFPHGMRIRVIEHVPVAVVVVAGKQIAVAGDGTLLHDANGLSGLPQIPLRVPPGGTSLSDAGARSAVATLAAAPAGALGRIVTATTVSGHGVVLALRSGPSLYFGSATQLAQKWQAALAVLGDRGSVGASYIDVSDPRRPVAGSGSAAGTGSSASDSTSISTTLTTTTTG